MRRLLLACCIFICACCASVPKAYPFYATPLSPEGWYQVLYDEVLRCAEHFDKVSGRRYADIEWFIVPAGAMGRTEDGFDVAGLWSAPNRIYLDARFAMNGSIVKHELTHAVISKGDNGHDDAIFKLCSGMIG